MLPLLARIPAYLCVATCLAELIWFGAMWQKGKWGNGQVEEIVAVIYDVDPWTLREKVERVNRGTFHEPVDISQLVDRELLVNLDLDLRERRIENGIEDLRFFEEQLADERGRYDELRQLFERRTAEIQGTATSRDVEQMRMALEVMEPRQAKEQLIELFDASNASGDEEISNDAVAILKSMPIDKRRRVIAEFQDEDDLRRLAEIIRKIRLGFPEVPLVRQTRDQLQQFDPRFRQSVQ